MSMERRRFDRHLGRHARIAGRYLGQIVKVRLQYRADFIIECVSSLLTQACGLMVIAIIFANVPMLEDWSREEVFFIYGFALVVQALFESVAEAFYWFSDKYIMRGEFDRVMLRPLNPLFQILLENFSFESFPDLILGLGILAWSGAAIGISWGLSQVLLLFLMAASAVLVLAGIFTALASVSFWVEDRVGVLPPFYNLTTFGRYPITIYHAALRFLLTFILPYGFIAFYPSTGLLDRDEFRAYFWATPAAGVITFLIGYAIFQAGIRRYRSTGS